MEIKCTRCRHRHTTEQRLTKPLTDGMTVSVCPKCAGRNYYDMTPMYAWCWASGLIEFGATLPKDGEDGSGAIVIAEGPAYALEACVSVLARHAYDGRLLVPGVPEAGSQHVAGKALADWLAWCGKSNGRRYRNGVVFKTRTPRAQVVEAHS